MTRQAPATATDRAPRTDEELLAAVRAQEPHAFRDLRDRHWPTAVAVAGLHTPAPQDAEQLAGTAVDQVVADLSAEESPRAFLRARLVDVVGRAATRSPQAAEAVTGVFLGLPADRQAVLWHADVEGLEPARVAEILGRTTAAATALHLEARAELRTAYRRASLELPGTAGCEALAGDLGAFVGGALAGEPLRRVQQHLDDCPRCAADHLYLQDTEAGLRGRLLPALAGVSPWGAKAQEVAALVRAAGRTSAERMTAGPRADVAGRSLAAVAVSRRGRQVLVGAGALAAAAALAGVAVTGQGEAGPQAADPRGGESVSAPGSPGPTSTAGPLSTSPARGQDGPAVDADAGPAERLLSLPTTEPSPGPLTEPAARARGAGSRGGAVLTAGGSPAQDGATANRTGDAAGGGTAAAATTAPGAGSTGARSSGTTGAPSTEAPGDATAPAGASRAGGTPAAGTGGSGTGGRDAGGTSDGSTSAGRGGSTAPAPGRPGRSPDGPSTQTGGSGTGAPVTESPAPPAPDTTGQVPDAPSPGPGPLPPAADPGALPGSPPAGVPVPLSPEDLVPPVAGEPVPGA
ncbi:zf-HC2 domain-containing protein [Kocuria sp. M1R5S2]|uniref:zf-HC2 domain-containing protein n=1 Tax=Kocuria rhizosphaerae TaxID=3376285 RepID=UPI00378978F3